MISSTILKAYIFTLVLFIIIQLNSCSPQNSSYEKDSSLIKWNLAKNHIGEFKQVEGQVVDSHFAMTSNGKPTFLNIGKPYPEKNRFTVVIWGDYRDNFDQKPEDYYCGKKIRVSGKIREYKNIPEIFVKSPDHIMIIE